MANYDNLEDLDGNDNIGGFSKIFVVPSSWVASVPAPVAGGNPGEKNLITGDITFNDPLTQGFLELYSTPDTELLASEPVGERDGRTKTHTTTFFHPGNDEIKEEWFDQAQNERWVVIEKECETGKMWLFGNDCKGAEIFAAFNSGQGDGTGRKGYTVTIVFNGKRMFYTGAVNLKP